jgi:putative ABC transport system permease protein
VFTPLDRARTYAGVSPNKATDAFRSRSRSFWLFGTGAGAALFAGALLGMIVGVIIVAQTLYASTKEFANEFATLRAIFRPAGTSTRSSLSRRS